MPRPRFHSAAFNPPARARKRGSAFIAAVVFSGVLSITVASLLKYMTNEYILNQRSHQWNQALHLSEAAVEIGFAELQFHHWQGQIGFQSSRGWVSAGSGVFTRTVPAYSNNLGQVVGSLSVTVSNAYGMNPVITGIGTASNNIGSAPTVSRGILAILHKSSQFPVALLSREQINMNGNNVYVDSYDSSDLTKSNNGLYDFNKRQANGNVASNGTITNTVNIGNADVYGVAYTGVGGSVALGPNGSIGPTLVTGDRATTVAAAKTQGWIQNDFNVDVPSVVLPPDAKWVKPAGTVGSGDGQINKSITLNTGDWKVGTVTLNSSQQGDVMRISGNVRLWVTGGFDISGLGSLVIDPGASLKVYIGGNAKIAGQGWINNAGLPDKNVWFALNTSTSWDVVGNGTFVGAIYAPNATVNFRGGGTNGDASGSVIARRITLTGNTKFHYDENLRNSDTGAGYSFVTWQELRKSGNTWVRN